MSLEASFISHQIWLQRNASHEVNQLAPFIQEMRDEVRAQVLAFGDDNRTRQRLQAMLLDLDDALSGVSGDWVSKLTDDMRVLADYEAQWTTRTLGLNVNASFTAPSPQQVWSAILFDPLSMNEKPVDFVKMLDSWSEVEVNRLVTGVKSGFVQGQTTRDIVKSVIGPGGLADVSQRNAATTVRTAVNHVSSEARQQVYLQNSDIIEYYDWISTLDSHTSAICRYRDGMRFRVGKGPLPPAHPNCRSGTLPVVSSDYDFLDEGAKRAARGADGGMQVDAKTTYYEFLKQQPAWFQDKAIGPVRGKIFRNAGLTPEEFRVAAVDGFGRPLTIEQMAEADQRVAEYLKGL